MTGSDPTFSIAAASAAPSKWFWIVGVDIHDATNISLGKIKDLKCFSVARTDHPPN
jgi:hypothetical protein